MTDDKSKVDKASITNSLHSVDAGIFIGIGSNLPLADGDSPLGSCRRGLRALSEKPLRILARSRWYRSAPVPASDQPDFVNGAVRIETALSPPDLLAALHEVEDRLGRVRRVRNEARVVDLDLIAYGRLCCGPDAAGGGPVLPHPRLEQRAFVLLPLGDIAAGWRHPRSGRTLAEMIAALPPGQRCAALPRPPIHGPDVIDFA